MAVSHTGLRGHAQTVRLYGTRGGTPVVVSSGDGGWMHLGPRVADVLAAKGYFVLHGTNDRNVQGGPRRSSTRT